MNKWLALLLAALALGLVAAGCGGDDDDDGGNGGGSADTAQQDTAQQDTGGGGGEPAGGGETEVQIIDNDYDPKDVTVSAGSTVKWTNAGQSPHTVTGDNFDSGTVEPGNDFSQSFEEAGEFSYVCTIHPGQEGTVTVE